MHIRTPQSFSIHVIVAAALLLAEATASFAAPITVPTGLSPGDPYRLAFVTSAARDATSPNIADYNAFVTGVANTVPDLVALGTTWTAIASTPTVDARDNTNTNPNTAVGVPIYLLNDTLLVNDNADLWDSSIAVPLQIDEQGLLLPVEKRFVWTGSERNGTGFPGGNELGGTTGLSVFGNAYFAINVWVFLNADRPEFALSLYALSDTLIAVPEPGTAGMFALGLVAMACVRRRSG